MTHRGERLRAGESFNNPKLTDMADKSFGGTRAQGRYTSRDAYDALEIAVNKYLDSVLEPSAGTGSLAIWSRSISAQSICNEINPRRNALLTQELGFETYLLDAEIIDDLLPAEPHIKICSKRYRLLLARKR